MLKCVKSVPWTELPVPGAVVRVSRCELLLLQEQTVLASSGWSRDVVMLNTQLDEVQQFQPVRGIPASPTVCHCHRK
jgi:hypothetical protein